MVVNPAAVSPAVKDIAATVHRAAEEAREVAAETTHDLRERLVELRDEVAKQAASQHAPPKQSHRGRSFVLIVLAAIGIAAIVMAVKRRQEQTDYGPSSDAFGAAVVEQQRASDDGEPVVTPGA